MPKFIVNNYMDKKDEILEKIKEEKIVPKSKWSLNWKNYLLWAFLAVAVVFSSLLLSLAILNFLGVDRDVVRFFHLGGLFWFILKTLPIFWLASSLVIVVLAFLSFRGTKRSYRYNGWLVAFSLLLFVSFLAAGLHVLGLNHKMESGLERAPGLRGRMPHPGEGMNFPDKGVLAGRIIKKEEGKIFIFNPMEKQWEVRFDENKVDIDKRVRMTEGERVMIFGKKLEKRVFEAEIIRPMERRREELRIKN